MPGTQAIFAEGFFVEEARRAELRIEFLVVRLVENLRLDSQVFEQTFGDLAVFGRTFNRLSSAVA